METLEYRTIDKSGWLRGEWDDEPDKKQWPDAETGLPCLMVRNQFGNWCGYVGMTPRHPWHGKSYSDAIPRTPQTDEALNRPAGTMSPITMLCAPLAGEGNVSLDILLDCHGGITFAGRCMDFSQEAYQKWRRGLEESRPEAKQYPGGDSARRLRETGHIGTYDEWVEHYKARAICHVPAPDDPSDIWWFGFDCGHCDDYSPGMQSNISGGIYRTLAYTESEVTKLAKQVAVFS